MRIRTDTAASAASLADYLRRCECIVEVIDERTIEATVRPQSFAAPHAQIELEGYLTVWQAMHPEALIEHSEAAQALLRAAGWEAAAETGWTTNERCVHQMPSAARSGVAPSSGATMTHRDVARVTAT